MRTLSFATIVAGALDMVGQVQADLSADQFASLVRKINRRVAKAARYDRWPEWVLCEPRLYRGEYAAGTTYAAPTVTTAAEIFYRASNKYFQALRATTGNAPATLASGVYETNTAYWAECAPGYEGDDWADAVAYAVGAVVRNPVNGRYYACHTAHTSATTLDGTKFGVLTPFAPYVAKEQAGQTPIGEVIRVTERDPAVSRANPGPVRFAVRATGIVPLGCMVPEVWVEFRRRVPIFTSTAWAAASSYAAGATVYSSAAGECYTAQAAITGNASNPRPEADAANWALIEFPEVLAPFVIRATGSDLLRADGQNEKADREQAQAYAEMTDDRDIEMDGQSLSEQVQVTTY